MRSNFLGRLEAVANFAIITVAILLAVVLVKGYLWPAREMVDALNSPATATQRNMVGQSAAIPAVDWKSDVNTVVMVLSTTCHFCSESTPFYQKLVEERKDHPVIAVFPQSVDEGTLFLRTHGVKVSTVRSETLEATGVDGTPTLLLVDRDGKIVKAWKGKLDPGGESEVLKAVLEGT